MEAQSQEKQVYSLYSADWMRRFLRGALLYFEKHRKGVDCFGWSDELQNLLSIYPITVRAVIENPELWPDPAYAPVMLNLFEQLEAERQKQPSPELKALTTAVYEFFDKGGLYTMVHCTQVFCSNVQSVYDSSEIGTRRRLVASMLHERFALFLLQAGCGESVEKSGLNEALQLMTPRFIGTKLLQDLRPFCVAYSLMHRARVLPPGATLPAEFVTF